MSPNSSNLDLIGAQLCPASKVYGIVKRRKGNAVLKALPTSSFWKAFPWLVKTFKSKLSKSVISHSLAVPANVGISS